MTIDTIYIVEDNKISIEVTAPTIAKASFKGSEINKNKDILRFAATPAENSDNVFKDTGDLSMAVILMQTIA